MCVSLCAVGYVSALATASSCDGTAASCQECGAGMYCPGGGAQAGPCECRSVFIWLLHVVLREEAYIWGFHCCQYSLRVALLFSASTRVSPVASCVCLRFVPVLYHVLASFLYPFCLPAPAIGRCFLRIRDSTYAVDLAGGARNARASPVRIVWVEATPRPGRVPVPRDTIATAWCREAVPGLVDLVVPALWVTDALEEGRSLLPVRVG